MPDGTSPKIILCPFCSPPGWDLFLDDILEKVYAKGNCPKCGKVISKETKRYLSIGKSCQIRC
jgi:hypothetical protein